MLDMILAAWRYRHFVLSSVQSEFKIRFARSRLGALWAMLNPLGQVGIFVLVFSEVMAAKLPGMTNDKYAYVIYLLSGMLCWAFFFEVIGRSVGLFVENGNLLKKISFPRVCLPLIVVSSALVNNVLLFISILIVFGLLGYVPPATIFWVPLLIAINAMLCVGVGLVVGVVNVFVRDVGQVVPVVLQLGFWFTPIVYTPEIIPDSFQSLVSLNPVATLVIAYQDAILYGNTPQIETLSVLTLAAAAILIFALILFRRASSELVDAL